MGYIRYFIVCVYSLAILVGCQTQRVVEKEYVARRDTLRELSFVRDSVVFRDSVFTFVKGETLIIKEYHYGDKLVLRHDTVYRSSDSVSNRNNVVTIEVSKPLSWWQKALMYIGSGFLVVMFICVLLKFKQ